MSLSIATNLINKTAVRSFTESSQRANSSMEKLTTGKRINRAGDDAAAISISAKLDTIPSAPVSISPWDFNMFAANDSSFYLQENIQYGDLDTSSFVLDFSNDIDPDNAIQINFDNSGVAGTMQEGVTIALVNINVGAPSVQDVEGTTNTKQGSLADFDIILDNLGRMNSVVSKYKSRLDAAFDYAENQKVSFSEYKSHVTDADMAEESSKFTREQIRQNTSAAMISQANAQSQFVLNLIP